MSQLDTADSDLLSAIRARRAVPAPSGDAGLLAAIRARRVAAAMSPAGPRPEELMAGGGQRPQSWDTGAIPDESRFADTMQASPDRGIIESLAHGIKRGFVDAGPAAATGGPNVAHFMPPASGVSGAIGETVGGLAGGLLNPAHAAENVLGYLTGAEAVAVAKPILGPVAEVAGPRVAGMLEHAIGGAGGSAPTAMIGELQRITPEEWASNPGGSIMRVIKVGGSAAAIGGAVGGAVGAATGASVPVGEIHPPAATVPELLGMGIESPRQVPADFVPSMAATGPTAPDQMAGRDFAAAMDAGRVAGQLTEPRPPIQNPPAQSVLQPATMPPEMPVSRRTRVATEPPAATPEQPTPTADLTTPAAIAEQEPNPLAAAEPERAQPPADATEPAVVAESPAVGEIAKPADPLLEAIKARREQASRAETPAAADGSGQEAGDAGEGASNRIGLGKAEQDRIRKDSGLSDLPEAERRTWETVLDTAKRERKDASAIATAREAMNSGRPITDAEHAGMVIKAADLANEYDTAVADASTMAQSGNAAGAKEARARADGILADLDTLTEGARHARREIARAMSIGRMMVNREDFQLAPVIQRARAAKGGELSPKESARFEEMVRKHAELEARLKQADERFRVARAGRDKLAAQRVIRQRARTEAKALDKAAILEERESIKKKLVGLGYRANDITGVSAEAAYLIGRLAVNYMHEGLHELKDVVKRVREDLPDLTESDVYQAIATRDPKRQAIARTAAEKRVAELQAHARLLAQIDKAERGVFDRPPEKSGMSGAIAVLRNRLGELRESAYKSVADASRLEKTIQTINELQDHLENATRAVRKKPAADTPEIAGAKALADDVRGQIREQDESIRLQRELATGERDAATPKPPKPVSEGLNTLRERVKGQRTSQAQAAEAARLEEMVAAGKVETGEPRSATAAIPELQAAREKMAALRRLTDTKETLANLQEQLQTGVFEVKEKPARAEIPRDLEDLQIKVKKTKAEIRAAIRDSEPVTVRKAVGAGLNTLRTIKATADMSAGLRQGLVLSVRRPTMAVRSFGKAAKAFFSEHTAEQIDHAIRSDPNHYLRERAKLYLADVDTHKVSAREEAFMSNLSKRIPIFRDVVAASERHAVTFLNLLRTSAFDAFAEKNPNATRAELAAWADFVNKASGRGDLGKLAGASTELAAVLFSPRYTVSRFQTPAAVLKYWRLPRVRAEIAKDMAAVVGLGGLALTLAGAAGARVGLDPRDADFGKITIGHTHIDLWAGFAQPARLISRIGLIATDRVGITGRDLTDQAKDVDPVDLLARFAAFKLSPAVTVPMELARGKSAVGEETPPTTTMAKAVLPMLLEDIYEAYKADGAGMAATSGALSFMGAGSSTYGDDGQDLLRERHKLNGIKKAKQTPEQVRRLALLNSFESANAELNAAKKTLDSKGEAGRAAEIETRRGALVQRIKARLSGNPEAVSAGPTR